MPQRNSIKEDQVSTTLRRSPRFLGNNTMIQPQPTTILRRSLRFLAKNQDESEDPKTPTPEKKKGTTVTFLETSSCISTPKGGCLKVSNPRNSVAQNVLKESNLVKEGSGKEINGLRRREQVKAGGEGLSCVRRSLRLSGKENVNPPLNFDEFKKEGKDVGNKDMRVTRNSARKDSNEKGYDGKPLAVSDSNSANFLGKDGLSSQQSGTVVIGLPGESIGYTKKTGNSKQGNAQKLAKKFIRNRIDRSAEDSKAELLDKGASLSVERTPESGLGPSDQETVGAPSRAPVNGKSDARAVAKKEKSIAVKRKRNQVEDGGENQGTVCGWTKEQDSALQKAYYAANPTPRFWKKVARMVPGKSAQDCFDRIHADYLTPRQTQPRSRARLLNSSPRTYSASKLLDSVRPKSKRPGYTKRKTHLVQKTMRQLLQKHCQVDRDQNADLFSILEPKSSLSPNALQQGVNCSTPKQEKPVLLKRCQETSSSANRMQCSQFNSMSEASLASPRVLKPIKNKALHEKYIDKLHAREAKRKAAAARAAKSNLQVLDPKECRGRKNTVESAKNALLLDARDAIKQFQQLQANDLSSFPDDDDVLYSDEDIIEDEDGL